MLRSQCETKEVGLRSCLALVASWPATVTIANTQLFADVMAKPGKGMARRGFSFHFDVSLLINAAIVSTEGLTSTLSVILVRNFVVAA